MLWPLMTDPSNRERQLIEIEEQTIGDLLSHKVQDIFSAIWVSEDENHNLKHACDTEIK